MLPMLPMLPMLTMLSILNAELALGGESIEFVVRKRSPPGIYSLIGDNESGLKATVGRTCGGRLGI